MPLRDVVIFPHAIVPLLVGRESSIRAVESAFTAKGPRLIFMVTQKDSSQEKSTGATDSSAWAASARSCSFCTCPTAM